MFPRHRVPRSATAFIAAAASIVNLAVASPAVARAATGPAPKQVIKDNDCLALAKPDPPRPILGFRTDIQARVDIRGTLKLRHGRIGPLKVSGCAPPHAHLFARTYVLVKAPSSNRYIVALTKWTTTSRQKQTLAAPVFADEETFSAAIAPMPQKLTIPGINGTVYGPLGSPIALLAAKATGRPYSHKAKVALAKAYIATGGFASQPGV